MKGFVLSRPSTIFNRGVDMLKHRLSPREISHDNLRRWEWEARAALGSLKLGRALIDKIHTDVDWTLVEGPAPENVWSLDIEWPLDRNLGAKPVVRVYLDSILARHRINVWFETVGQISVDQAAAHLYLWFAGKDYGEESAIKLAYRMLQHRQGLLNRVAEVAYKPLASLHKRVRLA